MTPTRRRWATALLLFLVAAGGTLLSAGCSSTQPRRDPTGEMFPSVVGESLEGQEVRLPEDFAGAPALFLVGYVQQTQFDLDRWLLGLHQMGVEVAVREVPTIRGLAPGMFANFIDSGMRRGIPEEDWGAVVTLYSDAGPVVDLTGNENGNNGRILLLDAQGRVAYFHDRGYSVGALQQLVDVLATLRDE